ncbi:MAG: STAS domain-containing protein [Actinomycetota bacterium]|nr:STAS domain-containing protein [Actinomycetota bacterium]
MAKEMKPLETYGRRREPLAVKELQNDLIGFLKDMRSGLREPWAKKMISFGFQSAKSPEVVNADYDTLYDALLDCFETGEYEKVEARAGDIVTHFVPKKRDPEESIVSVVALRDLIEGPLLERFANAKLQAILSVYLPVMNNIISSIAVELLRTVHGHIDEEQQMIRELSIPVLQITPGLLMLPIIGLVDSFRVLQLTEALLEAVSANRAEVAVIDLTGMGVMDSQVANHLIQTAEAVRLMGAKVFFTGLSSETAQTLVQIGVDLSKINVRGDLQDGIEAGAREIRNKNGHLNEAA